VFVGAYGEGVLEAGQKVDSYYNSFTGSWGLQAGASLTPELGGTGSLRRRLRCATGDGVNE